MDDRPKVAIIGAGAIGLVALKNLLEEGFDATAFERNDYVGGLWHFTEDTGITSVTKVKFSNNCLYTQFNSCSQMACYTDFPFPPGTPDYPYIAEVQSYLESYCDHFGLSKHIRLSQSVIGATVGNITGWQLQILDKNGKQREECFDRLVIAVGECGLPLWPKNITGLENFKGQVLHAQAYKSASKFADRKVLVLGFSNTAMDCAVELVGHAKKIYLSHRHGGMLVPRWDKHGLPVEFQASLKLQAIGRILERINPERWFAYFNSIVLKISTDAFGQLPAEWGLNKPPKDRMSNPIFNDKIVELLHEGKVEIVPALRNITASGDIELSNGHVISDVDTIILCTGYTYDFSHVPESVNPTRFKNAQWEATDRTNGRELYRLYQGIFSLDCPDSLAYLGVAGYPSSQFPLYDLVTMALAQVWKGAVKLPSQEEMNAEVDKRHATLLSRAAEDGLQIVPFEMDAGAWTKWLHDVAGTGFNERFNYGLKGWWYWLKDFRNMSNLMSGVNSPHLWRLFDGRRKKWDGAAKAIQKVNEDISRRKREASGSRKTKMK